MWGDNSLRGAVIIRQEILEISQENPDFPSTVKFASMFLNGNQALAVFA